MSEKLLTERQKQVLRLSLLPYRVVGEKLYISRSTVTTHMNCILQKLCVNNAGSAVIEAIRLGEIKLEEIEVHQ